RGWARVTLREIQGGTGRHAAVVLVHVLVRPRTNWWGAGHRPAGAGTRTRPGPGRHLTIGEGGTS
ncbi:hypothetical protein ACWCQQ_43600, partial [Streptomyces sp. NPDC002143]